MKKAVAYSSIARIFHMWGENISYVGYKSHCKNCGFWCHCTSSITFQRFQCTQMWIQFGSGETFTPIPIHSIWKILDPDICKYLIFFHAFTACDTCSSFFGIGKVTTWKCWNSLQSLKPFVNLFQTPHIVEDENFKATEAFVCKLYDEKYVKPSVDLLRCNLFLHTRHDQLKNSLLPQMHCFFKAWGLFFRLAIFGARHWYDYQQY